MRRVLPLFLLASLISGCDPVSTGITAAVAADPVVQGQITHVRILATRDGQPKLDEIYKAKDIPGSLTFVDESDGEKKSPLRVSVQGFYTNEEGKLRDRILDAQVSARISRSAQVNFVAKKTKLLRMGLSAKCLGDPCKDKVGTTCLAGECVSEVVPDPGALPDAPSDPNEALILGNFTDLDPNAKGGSGGSGGAGAGGAGSGGAGSGGAGSGGAGEGGAGGAGAGGAGGAGAGGSDPCDGLPALEITSAGGLLEVGSTVVLEAPSGAGAELVWKLTVAGSPVEPAGVIAGETISITVDFCEAQLEVSDSKCSKRTSQPLTLKATGKAGSLIANSRCSADKAIQCGSRLQPWCDFAGPLGALATIKPEDGGTPDDPSDDFVALKVEAYDPNDAKTEYSGPLVLPPGVSVWGGYDPAKGQPFPVSDQKRSRLRWVPGISAADPIAAGTTITDSIRSVLVVTAGPGAPPKVSLRDLEVQMPQAPDTPPPAGPKSLFTGIHLHRNLDALLERVAVLPGDALPETTDGVYVSGGTGNPDLDGPAAERVIRLIDCDIQPSASSSGFSNGVKIDSQTSTRLLVCGGKIGGGGAQDKTSWSAGMLLWGQADTIIDGLASPLGPECKGFGPAWYSADIPEITGGPAFRSYGAVLDAQVAVTPPVPWFSLREARVVGLSAAPFKGAEFPPYTQGSASEKPEAAGLLIHAFRPVSVELGADGAPPSGGGELTGLDMQGAGIGTPAFGLYYGILTPHEMPGSPNGPDSLDGVSLSIKQRDVMGVRGGKSSSAPNACEEAWGAYLEAPNDNGGLTTIQGSTLVGGGACTARTGATLQEMSLDLASSSIRGSADKGFDPNRACDSASGVRLNGYNPGKPVLIKGGRIEGGDDGDSRHGVYANGASALDGVDVEASLTDGGFFVAGVECFGDDLASFSIQNSKITGGLANHPSGSGTLAGVLVEHDGKVSISSSTIQGCKQGSECKNVSLYGVKYAPKQGLSANGLSIDNQSMPITAGWATQEATGASEVVGVLVESNNLVTISNAQIRGCEEAHDCVNMNVYGVKLLRGRWKPDGSSPGGSFLDNQGLLVSPPVGSTLEANTIVGGLGSCAGAGCSTIGVLAGVKELLYPDPGNASNLLSLAEPLRVRGKLRFTIENNTIVGNDTFSSARPFEATGVEVRGGGVAIKGTAGDPKATPPVARAPQKIRAGNAQNFTKGAKICSVAESEENAKFDLYCENGGLLDSTVEAGDALISLGLDVGRMVLWTANANEIRAIGGNKTFSGWGALLELTPGGTISNNYFFGAKTLSGTDTGCELLAKGPSQGGAIQFIHNACISAAAGAANRRGILVRSPAPQQGQSFRLMYNLGYAPDTIRSYSWVLEKDNEFMPLAQDPSSAGGNTCLPEGPLKFPHVATDFPLANCFNGAADGYFACNVADSFGDSVLDGIFVGHNSNTNPNPEMLPGAGVFPRGDDPLALSAWHPMSKLDCGASKGSFYMPGFKILTQVFKDFDGDDRVDMNLEYSPNAGPDSCTTPLGQ